jgi:hypothetical protein
MQMTGGFVGLIVRIKYAGILNVLMPYAMKLKVKNMTVPFRIISLGNGPMTKFFPFSDFLVFRLFENS